MNGGEGRKARTEVDIGGGRAHFRETPAAETRPVPDNADAPPPQETPIQKALRLKQEAIAARPKPPRGGRFQREQAAAHASSSKSKPWMER